MQIEIDEQHAELIERAVVQGRAPDAAAYVRALIEDAATETWLDENRGAVESLLKERLKQKGVTRDPSDHEGLRKRLEAIREMQNQKRTA